MHQDSGFDTGMEKEVIDEANKTGETACELKGKTTVKKACAEPSNATVKAFSDQDGDLPAQN